VNTWQSVSSVPAATVKKARNQHKMGLCPSCKVRNRYVSSSGHINTYCKECKNDRQKIYDKNKKQFLELNELSKRIPNHKKGKCPKCDSPRHVTKTGIVTTYCSAENTRRSKEHYNKTKKERFG
jgi:hypothetical protein